MFCSAAITDKYMFVMPTGSYRCSYLFWNGSSSHESILKVYDIHREVTNERNTEDKNMQTRSALLQEPCHLKKNVSEMRVKSSPAPSAISRRRGRRNAPHTPLASSLSKRWMQHLGQVNPYPGPHLVIRSKDLTGTPLEATILLSSS